MSKKSISSKNNKSIPSILEKGEENQDMKLNASPMVAASLTNNFLEDKNREALEKKRTSTSMYKFLSFFASGTFFAILTALAVKFYIFSKKKTDVNKEQN